MQDNHKSELAIEQLKVAQRTFGIKSFLAVFYVIQCSRLMQLSLAVAIVRTLERRFGLNSGTLGIVAVISDCVVIVTVLFIGYAGNKVHIPRFLSFATALLAVSSISVTVPYFIFGPLKTFYQ